MKYLNKKFPKYLVMISVLICAFTIFTNLIYPSQIVYGEGNPAENGEFYKSNPNMRIGLIFGSGTVGSFQTTAPNGFIIGMAKQNASDCFNSFFYLKNTKIAVTPSANLAKNSAGTYYANNKNIVIGKYSLEYTQSFSNFTEAYSFINKLRSSVSINVYPAYTNNKITVRLGDFSSAENAKAYMSKVSGYTFNVAADPAKTALVVNPDTNEILFVFSDGDNNLAIAGASASNPANSAYGQKITELSANTTGVMTSPANNLYSGAFIYRVSGDGVEVIGLISLEDYIKDVVPNEVYPSWEKESLKAFAITARTFAVHSAFVGNRHAGSGFMLCNTTHCQLYVGHKKANDATNGAVDETKDLIITYENQPIQSAYHAASGGVTENHNDAWGGELRQPYLVSVPLPFEKYEDPSHVNALWTKSASPRELFEYLTETSSYSSRFKGVLKSDIANITINKRSPGSNYVKSVSVTDKNGNTVTIDNSDAVRIAFAKYANSANMDIYKSFKFKYPVVNTGSQELEAGRTNIITSNGVRKLSSGNGKLTILTSSGTSTVNAYASGNDFIFDGRGWGHGVGMSQWAAQDLALLGYGYEEIIKAFFTNVSIENITKIKWKVEN